MSAVRLRSDNARAAEKLAAATRVRELPYFSDAPLDRAAHLRDCLTAEALTSGLAKVILCGEGHVLCYAAARASVGSESSRSSLDSESSPKQGSNVGGRRGCGQLAVCQGGPLLDRLRDANLPVVFLGSDHSASPNKWFAAEVAAPAKLLESQPEVPVHPFAWSVVNLPQESHAAVQNVPEASMELQWLDLRSQSTKLAAPQAALAATAHGLLAWHRANRVSALSGHPMSVSQAGWALQGSPSERCYLSSTVDFQCYQSIGCVAGDHVHACKHCTCCS
jgi:hypothetical protein